MRTKLLKTFATLAMLVCSLSASAEAITDISQLRDGMIYHISTRRGAWAVAEDTYFLQSTGALGIPVDSNDPRQQFTFITINGSRYLYHIAKRRFLRSGGCNSVPEEPIYFNDGAYENTFVAYLDVSNRKHYININGDVLFNDYSIADDGNSCTILPVGESPITLVDGIYYLQIAEGELEVIHVDNLSGVLNIPATITIKGKTYRVTSIGDGAFRSCPNLTSVNIPGGVTYIGDMAFCQCSSLTSVNIPEGVTYIGAWAFLYSGITNINIPASVTSIGEKAFLGCESLTSITVDSGNEFFDSRDNCNAIISKENNVLSMGCSNTIIPEGVISIANHAFDSSGLTTITIPEGVTSIGNGAFQFCSNLTTITLPESVTSIGESAFESCSITSITIPESVTSIGEDAFWGCSNLERATINCANVGSWLFSGCSSIKEIVLGEGVTSIGESAFSGCSSLTDVYCYAEHVLTLSSNAFKNVDCSKITLHVPKSVIGDYMDSPSWNVFGKIVKLMVPGEQVTSLSHLSNDKVYTLRSARAFLLHSDVEEVAGKLCSSTGTKVGAVEYSLGDPAQHFRIEKQGDNYYLYSVGAGQYVDADGNYVSSATAALKIDNVGGNYPWKLCLGDHGMNSQDESQTKFKDMAEGILFDSWTTTDEGNCYQIVEAATPSITLNQYLLTLAEGEAVELTATVNPDIVAGDPVTWSSSNPSVATVDATGTVTAVAAGTATITASLYDGRVAVSCDVTVFLGRCEAPTINYANGKVVLDCGTEDVQFVTETKSDNPHTAHSTDKEFDFVPSYTITTYATKNDYAASKVVTVTLCWIACGEQHEEGETDILNIPSKPVFIQSQGGVLTLTGLADDTEVVVFTTGSIAVATATATNGTATLTTGLEAGSIAIVKIGDYSIKVAIK